MIRTMRVAYTIGFSCSLSPDAFSAYNDAAKWKFDDSSEDHLVDAFCRGWADGKRLLNSVKTKETTNENNKSVGNAKPPYV